MEAVAERIKAQNQEISPRDLRQLASLILYTIERVHEGQVTLPRIRHNVSTAERRWTPNFQAGARARFVESTAWTVAQVAAFLDRTRSAGKRGIKSSEEVSLCVKLIEAYEAGVITPTEFEIALMDPMTRKDILEKIKKKKA